MQKLDLLHIAVQIADDFEIGDAVGFAGFDEIFKDFLCVLFGVQQFDDLRHAAVLCFGVSVFLDVFDVLYANSETGDVVLVGADALRKDGRFGHKGV